MGPVDEMIKELNFDEVKKLLVDLAIHFSNKTKILAVPVGTSEWVVEVHSKNGFYVMEPSKTIRIQLVHFFGMYVGYNSEVDLLVMWET